MSNIAAIPEPDAWQSPDGSDALLRADPPPLYADPLDGLALTAHQAALLCSMWPHLDANWSSSPYFGTVREHTRAHIERLTRQATQEVAR